MRARRFREPSEPCVAEHRGPADLWRGQQAAGILTDRDIVVKCVATGCDPAVTTAGELAQGTTCTIDANASAEEVLKVMEDHRIHRLPVLDRGVGMISEADLARHLSGSQVGQFVEVVSSGLTGPPAR
jgi:CBS domain-containing protein